MRRVLRQVPVLEPLGELADEVQSVADLGEGREKVVLGGVSFAVSGCFVAMTRTVGPRGDSASRTRSEPSLGPNFRF